MRLTERAATEEILKGKEELLELGFNVTNFETDKISDYKLNTLLSQTVQKGGITILWAHTWSNNFDVERLKYIIQLAKKKNIKIVTLRESLAFHRLAENH